MENPIENNPERIASKEELLDIIARHAENAVITKEESDEKGISRLELRVEGEKEGTFSEFEYRREKNKTGKEGEMVLSIHQTFYEDEMPYTGKEIQLVESESGEWVEI